MTHRKNPQGAYSRLPLDPERAAQLALDLLPPGARSWDLRFERDEFSCYIRLPHSGPVFPCAMGFTWSDALLDLWQQLQVHGPCLERHYAQRKQVEARALAILESIGARQGDVAAAVWSTPTADGRYTHTIYVKHGDGWAPHFEGFDWDEALNQLSIELAHDELFLLQQELVSRTKVEAIVRRNSQHGGCRPGHFLADPPATSAPTAPPTYG